MMKLAVGSGVSVVLSVMVSGCAVAPQDEGHEAVAQAALTSRDNVWLCHLVTGVGDQPFTGITSLNTQVAPPVVNGVLADFQAAVAASLRFAPTYFRATNGHDSWFDIELTDMTQAQITSLTSLVTQPFSDGDQELESGIYDCVFDARECFVRGGGRWLCGGSHPDRLMLFYVNAPEEPNCTTSSCPL